jgi:hypothetical protein
VSLRRTAHDVALQLPEVVEEVEFLPLTRPQQLALQKADKVQHPLQRHHGREAAVASAEGRSSVAEAAVQRVVAPAAEGQRVGRLRRIGSPHAQVRHVALLTDTKHDRSKWAKVAQRGEDNVRVMR